MKIEKHKNKGKKIIAEGHQKPQKNIMFEC